MDFDALQQTLLQAASGHTPEPRVPYAFEKRVMARLATHPANPDPWQLWNRVLWRAAAPCIAVTVMLGAWNFLAGPSTAGADTLAAQLENTVLAPLDTPDDTW